MMALRKRVLSLSRIKFVTALGTAWRLPEISDNKLRWDKFNSKRCPCIGEIISPVQSDLVLTKCDTDNDIRYFIAIRVFRYVDDNLVIIQDVSERKRHRHFTGTTAVFGKCASGLTFTVEILVDREIRYLDVIITNGEGFVVANEHEVRKGHLPFNSAY